MSTDIPVIYTVEHASDDFGQFAARTALSSEQQLRFSDYGAGETVPKRNVIATLSRAVVDYNRAPDHPNLFPQYDFAKPIPNKIWKEGQEPNPSEQEQIYQQVYRPYHESIMEKVRQFRGSGIVVAWHNTAHYEIGKDESGKDQIMRPIILSNLGAEGFADANGQENTTSCDPIFLFELANKLGLELASVGMPNEVLFNFVYKGGYVAEHYNTRRHPELDLDQPLQSFQVEYDTILTHNQETLIPNKLATRNLRTAFKNAMQTTYREVFA